MSQLENRCKLFVGGLDMATTTQNLAAFFQQWGSVADANVMMNSKTMLSRGFGFIKYETPSMVDEAMRHRPHVIDGRSVETKRPMPRELSSAGTNQSCYRLLVRCANVDPQAAAALNQRCVHTYFSNFGRVVSVTPPQADPSGDFIVEFDDYDPVDKAMIHGTHQLNGQLVVINKDTTALCAQPGMSKPINAENSECKLFIGGLDHFTTEASLAMYFARFGEVVSTQVMIDPLSNRSRGFGFVTFSDTTAAERALSVKQHMVDSRNVEAKRFATRDQIKSTPAQHDNKSSANYDCKLFVGGLSHTVDNDALLKYFGQYGEIADGSVMKDSSTKRSRGFAFITYAAAGSVDAAMAGRPHSLDDKAVEIKRPMPRDLATPENTVTSTKLFCGAVKDGTTEQQMRQHFSPYGNIVSLTLPQARDSKRLRGFAFIEYDDYDSADRAIIAGRHEVNGKTLDVKKALTKDEMARIAMQSMKQYQMGNQNYPPGAAANYGNMPYGGGGYGPHGDASGYGSKYMMDYGGQAAGYPSAGYGQPPPVADPSGYHHPPPPPPPHHQQPPPHTAGAAAGYGGQYPAAQAATTQYGAQTYGDAHHQQQQQQQYDYYQQQQPAAASTAYGGYNNGAAGRHAASAAAAVSAPPPPPPPAQQQQQSHANNTAAGAGGYNSQASAMTGAGMYGGVGASGGGPMRSAHMSRPAPYSVAQRSGGAMATPAAAVGAAAGVKHQTAGYGMPAAANHGAAGTAASTGGYARY